jgi:hypothetical protein
MAAEVAMSEREMRDALKQVCDNLELEARARAKKRGRKLVYPLMVGAGLLVASCDDETDTDPGPEALYSAPSGTPTATQTGTGSGSGTTTGTTTGTATGGGGEGGAESGGGGVGGGATGGGAVGGGGQMDYMAPDP